MLLQNHTDHMDGLQSYELLPCGFLALMAGESCIHTGHIAGLQVLHHLEVGMYKVPRCEWGNWFRAMSIIRKGSIRNIV